MLEENRRAMRGIANKCIVVIPRARITGREHIAGDRTHESVALDEARAWHRGKTFAPADRKRWRIPIAVELQEGFSGAPQVELRRVNALIRIGKGRRRARGIGIRALGIASSRFSARGIRGMIEDIPIGRLLVASMCPVPVISAVEGVERRSRTRIRSFPTRQA